ncbi:3-hydroxybutyryl-CoA dehydrogenase [Anoxybacter fermentans]|uniref:3-hydroxybutyryl-CoA dehydrogenase n=1 Tax=Anoxybacter fermentans TaxID=1323375 RepID=A0A3S9T0I6_9FIRM|nr:3-hydroxybutyryl-CoA dehydrogenase [Anoxybacter fermentans]
MMKVGVIGAGTMGSGICQVLAQSGHQVYLVEQNAEFLNKGLARIEKGYDRNVKKERMTEEEKNAAMANITGIEGVSNLPGDLDLVIEAVVEELDVKKEVFKELDQVCDSKTILATNTSALSISEIAVVTGRPDKVVGMHFFNPVPVMKLVEVIRGAVTSDETFNFVKELAESLGKTPVEVKEAPGFVVNRILIPMINEAAYILMEGIASAEDIDKAMKLGANHPIGPLALADLIGLDVCLSIMETLYTEFGDPKYRPCPLLRKMVRANQLGRKTGQGFFSY